MKAYILTLGLLLFGGVSIAQQYQTCQVSHQTFTKKNFVPIGKPMYILNSHNGNMTMNRKPSNKFGYGTKVIFGANGHLIESYSAPCGNDANIHRSQGSWKVVQQRNGTSILMTSIPINRKGNKFKLIDHGNHYSLVPLKPINKKYGHQKMMHKKARMAPRRNY